MFTNKAHEEAHNKLNDGEIDAAIKLYTQALAQAPNDYNILSDRGVAYLHKNDKFRCFGDFNLAIELQPNYSYRYASRAFAKKHFGDIDGAIEDYEIAVNLDPDDAVAHNNLGMLLEEKGYKLQAEDRFAIADKLSEQENNLLDVIKDIENETSSKIVQIEELQMDESIDLNEEKQSNAKEFKKVFTSKNQFREFLKFVRNGFKIK